MRVKYIGDTKEWIATSSTGTFRISRVQEEYILETIANDDELIYCHTFEKLGDVLEAIERGEMFEQEVENDQPREIHTKTE